MKHSLEACKSMLKKSRGKFRSAQLAFDDDLFDSAISDLYYSAFQVVCALMVLKGLSVQKHTQVRAFVNRDLGLNGLISLDLIQMYNLLMNSREDADYKPDIFQTKEYTTEVLAKVRIFNEEMLKLINSEFGL